MTLPEEFARIQDHRQGRARRDDLQEMMVMAICAVRCGADSLVDLADWCEDEQCWLKTLWVLAHGSPSRYPFGKVFRVMDAAVFECCFRQ